jgi:tetratricopeptide (TPR) repeat protein
MKYICIVLLCACLSVISCTHFNNKNTTSETKTAISRDSLVNDIQKIESTVFNEMIIDTLKANNLIGKYVHFANTFFADTLAAEYLLRASEIAANVGQVHNSLNYLKRIETDYPDYKRYAFVLYYSGYLNDNILSNKEQARFYYNRFISEYPNHKLADEAKALLNMLEINDLDLIRQFETANEIDSL